MIEIIPEQPESSPPTRPNNLKDLTRQKISDRLDKAAEAYLRGSRDQHTCSEIIELHERLKELDKEESTVSKKACITTSAQAFKLVQAKFEQLATIQMQAKACRFRPEQPESSPPMRPNTLKDLTRQEISDRLDKAAEAYLRGSRDQHTRSEIIELHERLKELDKEESTVSKKACITSEPRPSKPKSVSLLPDYRRRPPEKP